MLRARIGRDGTTGAADLPDGTIIARERERLPDYEGGHAPLGGARGDGEAFPLNEWSVTVLTPTPPLDVFRRDFQPEMRASVPGGA
ncbi:hypothetical protein CVM50_00975 [Pseudooceanicola marinus]|nr:hypothetical protein CVM50_00975 [Pseudooceanicola marinus]